MHFYITWMHKYHKLIIGQVIGSLGQLWGVRCIQMKKDHALVYHSVSLEIQRFRLIAPLLQPKSFFSIPQNIAPLNGPSTLNILRNTKTYKEIIYSMSFFFFCSAKSTDSIQTILEKSKIKNTKSIRRYINICVIVMERGGN